MAERGRPGRREFLGLVLGAACAPQLLTGSRPALAQPSPDGGVETEPGGEGPVVRGVGASSPVSDARVRATLDLAALKLGAADVEPVDRYPHSANETQSTWSRTGPEHWTAGFYPGCLWQMYRFTDEPGWRTAAERWTQAMLGQRGTASHDIGFMLGSSAGLGHDLTGSSEYLDAVTDAAATLDAHFIPSVGGYWSLNGDPVQIIIDSMMNLDLVMRFGTAAQQQHAVSHAALVAAVFVRPDGSTFHVADFDRRTGRVVRRYTNQGYADWSTWARGQSWAVHGFTAMYHATGDVRFLTTARKTADYWVARLPSDAVPLVDFDAPAGPGRVKDSSAGAIAAAGLLQLSKLDPDPARARRYGDCAVAMFHALTTSPYMVPEGPGLLRRSAGRWTSGGTRSSFIWADFYLLEAVREAPRRAAFTQGRPVVTEEPGSTAGVTAPGGGPAAGSGADAGSGAAAAPPLTDGPRIGGSPVVGRPGFVG